MYFDLPLAELEGYRGEVTLPPDFGEFWRDTVSEARAHAWAPQRTRVDTPLTLVDVWDVTFAGFVGDPIKAWLFLPRGAAGPLPAVVHYQGYGGGRDHWLANLAYPAAGYALLFMDSRGQGSGWSVGATADPHGSGPAIPGVMTRGIADKATYYYRRLMTDAILAVDAVRAFPEIDPDRVAVTGASQGGGLTLAAAAFAEGVRAACPRVPFLTNYARAFAITDDYPYREVVDYLARHRDEVDAVMATLAYFDGVNFARLAAVPAAFTVALMDTTVPPSCVFAAYNNYAGEKAMTVWPHNGHESGEWEDLALSLGFFGQWV
ncbi:MAG: acetylxylan esterase [Propionibacteriaceae bacterium]|nr:acetylxylan esterase [Propionibacteriaceae bacterium]